MTIPVKGVAWHFGHLLPRRGRGDLVNLRHRRGWPNLFGPAHDSTSHEVIQTNWGPRGSAVLWEIPIGEGYRSPIVWKDKLIITQRIADEEIIECLDANDGQSIWEH